MALQIPARAGTPVVTHASGPTSSLLLPSTGLPKAQGNLALRWLIGNVGVATTGAISVTPDTGWSVAASATNVSGTGTKMILGVYYKFLSGGDTDPTFGFTNLTNALSGLTVIADEWSGLTGVPQVGTKISSAAAATSGTLTCGAVTATQAGSVLFGGRGLTSPTATGSPGDSWTADLNDPFTNKVSLAIAHLATTASGAQPAVTDTWSTNAVIQGAALMSFAFSIATIPEPLGWGIPIS